MQPRAQAANPFDQFAPAGPQAAPRSRTLPAGSLNAATAGDVALSTASGVPQGAVGASSTINDFPRMVGDTAAWVAQRLGLDPEHMQAGARGIATLLGVAVPQALHETPGPHPTSDQVNENIDQTATALTGRHAYHEPETMAGEFGRSVGQFAGGAIAPGSPVARAARVVVPAVTQETGGQVARVYAPEWETLVRAVTGLIAGSANEGLLNHPSMAPARAQITANARQFASELAASGVQPADIPAIVEMANKGAPHEDIQAAADHSSGATASANAAGGGRGGVGAANLDPAGARAELAARVGAPLTGPEMAGDAGAMLRQDDFYRGNGGGVNTDAAQNAIRDFYGRRAAIVQSVVRAIAERPEAGRDPATQPGSAGTTMATGLRDINDAMAARTNAHYTEARALAEATPPISSNQGASDLRQLLDEHMAANHFEMEPAAQGPRDQLAALADRIAEGKANWQDFETVRKNLTAAYGQALTRGDTNTARIIRGFIGDARLKAPEVAPTGVMDRFMFQHTAEPGAAHGVEATTPAGRYRQQVLLARQAHFEHQSMFGPQARVALGPEGEHTGNIDLGYQRFNQIINADLPEPLDKVFNNNGTFHPAALSIIRRIRAINDRLTHVPGSRATGAAGQASRDNYGISLHEDARTRGRIGLEADRQNPVAPTNEYPNGVQRPLEPMQALREGFIDRVIIGHITEEHLNGGALPAGRMATALNEALNGRGAEATRLIFTEGEVARLQDVLEYLRSIQVPAGAAYSGTPSGVSRAILASGRSLLSRLVGGALHKVTGGFSTDLANNLEAQRASRQALDEANAMIHPQSAPTSPTAPPSAPSSPTAAPNGPAAHAARWRAAAKNRKP